MNISTVHGTDRVGFQGDGASSRVARGDDKN